jgi:hypothetical protein
MRKFIGIVSIVLAAMLTSPLTTTQAHAWGLFDPNHREVNLADEMAGAGVNAYNGASNTIAIARSYLGHGHFRGMPGLWCRSFVNRVLVQGGYYTNRDNTVYNALHIGPHVSHPHPGDLVIMHGHITFFVGYDRNGNIIGLGGNQGGHRGSRLVTYSHYPVSRVIAYVHPVHNGAAYAYSSHKEHHYHYASRHSHRYVAYFDYHHRIHFSHWHHHHRHYAHYHHRHKHTHSYAYNR